MTRTCIKKDRDAEKAVIIGYEQNIRQLMSTLGQLYSLVVILFFSGGSGQVSDILRATSGDSCRSWTQLDACKADRGSAVQ